jgi:hypothetical protein
VAGALTKPERQKDIAVGQRLRSTPRSWMKDTRCAQAASRSTASISD